LCFPLNGPDLLFLFMPCDFLLKSGHLNLIVE
jgi:hypothetical protein